MEWMGCCVLAEGEVEGELAAVVECGCVLEGGVGCGGEREEGWVWRGVWMGGGC